MNETKTVGMNNFINVSNKGIQVRVSVFVYLDTEHPDGDMYIAYCPSLNLVGYGNGMENAKKDFEWIMEDYLDDMLKQGTLEKDLVEHGWKATKKSFSEPIVSDMVNHNQQLRDVVNKGGYQNINIDITCPAMA